VVAPVDRAIGRIDDDARLLARPVEREGLFDRGMEALADGTGFADAFEQADEQRRQRTFCQRQPHLHGQAHNTPRVVGGHFLGYLEAGAADLTAMFARDDRHGRKDARAERGGGEIGGRKRFAPALVVFGRVSHERAG